MLVKRVKVIYSSSEEFVNQAFIEILHCKNIKFLKKEEPSSSLESPFPTIKKKFVKKKNDNRVLPELDSTHEKCSYQQALEPFTIQWCHLAASVRLLLPTLQERKMKERMEVLVVLMEGME